ncbi:Chromosome (plasmid) partitioning protein ParA [Microbacterium esteraromaticum]|uniref:Chromosome (Plasmid) partitioning protein ParA n=1 Tax=Microbacterium esteraromaticum TaxID=57043 RepID=A0A1R4IZM6_9MICO|nr:ParA family protein [Microbacterium esteraromaticum]SJN25287.1 Chromosome (plasmid) partitioning protein ParA [Microbacterium esteraromaticum]
MTVYTLSILKGGSGKTTTAADLVAFLTASGRRVLAIDLDQQGNLTTRLGVTDDTEVSAVAADVLVGEASAFEAAIPSPSVPGARVLVGTQDLAGLDQRPEIITALRDHLPEFVDQWDDVVIDTPPALGLLTLSALAAADVVIAPVECATEAYDQLGKLDQFIAQRVAPRLRPGQRLHWVVPTKYHNRQLIDREVLELLTEQYPGRVTSPVREAVAAKDAYTDGKPVSVYAPRSAIAEDYAQTLATITGIPVPQVP